MLMRNRARVHRFQRERSAKRSLERLPEPVKTRVEKALAALKEALKEPEDGREI